MKCRHCGSQLHVPFIDLGYAPPSNAYIEAKDLQSPELYYPLKIYICDKCWLAQTEDYARADELFSKDYAYFSSTSKTWLEHTEKYVKDIIPRLHLNRYSFVTEIASNDGYLLKNFIAKHIPCIGIEPTASTAAAAIKLGVPTMQEFFGTKLAKQLVASGRQSDLIIGNNVYAHVPDINDFTAAMGIALKPNGTITLEFPHLMQLIKHTQFDTMYHEHYSYLSLTAVVSIFADAGLRIYDVEELPTHGGSLRIYGCHTDSIFETSESVNTMLEKEKNFGITDVSTYTSFQNKADKIKDNLLTFLIEQKRKVKKIAAYGAAAKGNTLLNYGGVKPDLLPFVCDAAPSKQGKYLPGSHIPILKPDELKTARPDIVLILPWNIADEIMDQLSYIRQWDGKFVVAVPEIKIL